MPRHLPPIPIPAAQRWRDFRLRVLPGVTLLCAFLAVVLTWRAHLPPVTVLSEPNRAGPNLQALKDAALVQAQSVPAYPLKTNQSASPIAPGDPKILASAFGGKLRPDPAAPAPSPSTPAVSSLAPSRP